MLLISQHAEDEGFYNGSGCVSNNYQGMLSGDALAALQQQLNRSSSAAAAMALQRQLLQGGQLSPDSASAPGVVPVAVADQYLTFSLSDCQFAVKADAVQGVERLSILTPVPNVASWLKGVMNLRGSIVSVVDLRAFWGLEPIPHTARTRLLSLQQSEMVICFMVDAITEMLAIPPSTIVYGNMRQVGIASWAAPYAAGMATVNNRAIILLDVARLLFSEKMQHYEL
jgi:purine-binding chemotaxis protein CheW